MSVCIVDVKYHVPRCDFDIMANIQPCKLRCEITGQSWVAKIRTGFGDSHDNEEEGERSQLKTP
jgi:hypothetical protein